MFRAIPINIEQLTKESIIQSDGSIKPQLELKETVFLSPKKTSTICPIFEIYKILNWTDIQSDINNLIQEIEPKLYEPNCKYLNYTANTNFACRKRSFFTNQSGLNWKYGNQNIVTCEYTPTMKKILKSIDDQLNLNFYEDSIKPNLPSIAICIKYLTGNFELSTHKDKLSYFDLIIFNLGSATKHFKISSLNKRENYEEIIDPGMIYLFKAPTNNYYTFTFLPEDTNVSAIILTWRKVN